MKNTILVHQGARMLSDFRERCTKNSLLSKLVSQDDEKGAFGWLGHLAPKILGQKNFMGHISSKT